MDDRSLALFTRWLLPFADKGSLANHAVGIEIGIRLAQRHPEWAERLLKASTGYGSQGADALDALIDLWVDEHSPVDA